MNGRNKGFTLIEMLVVVAVIGLLSSVILTALGPAKDKAKDSRIIQEINQIRSLAETFYNGNYDMIPAIQYGSFDNNIANPDINQLVIDIAAQGGDVGLIKSQPAPAKTYAVFSSLNIKVGDPQNPQTQYYCVDSAGHSLTTMNLPNDPVCPAN